MQVRNAGRGRISRNPFVRRDDCERAPSGDTLTRILDSTPVTALLRALVLLFVLDVALGAALTINGCSKTEANAQISDVVTLRHGSGSLFH